MKALLGPADINADDDGTRLVLIHAGSNARQDARDRGLFSLVKHAAPLHDKFGCMDCAMRKDARHL
jgi:hypothetical protein